MLGKATFVTDTSSKVMNIALQQTTSATHRARPSGSPGIAGGSGLPAGSCSPTGTASLTGARTPRDVTALQRLSNDPAHHPPEGCRRAASAGGNRPDG